MRSGGSQRVWPSRRATATAGREYAHAGSERSESPRERIGCLRGQTRMQARNDSVPGLVRVGQGSRRTSPSQASDAGARARNSGWRRQEMTRLDDGLDEPYSRRLGVTAQIVTAPGSPTRWWNGPRKPARRSAPDPGPAWHLRPAGLGGKPGIIARHSVAERLKLTAIRTRPRPSDHKSTPGRSVAERLKSALTRTRTRRSNLGRIPPIPSRTGRSGPRYGHGYGRRTTGRPPPGLRLHSIS
ncbi:hypothetical protein J2S69_000116 [Glycomyces lechevalierae]|uniref:Uncharacterized protein n=1 Tax=Glycomyces lechevalierae TaxID=256034 RepID=A0ABU2AGQ8_9ACTN|nr:hypothetical protein [Glycomyces lechevalierae]